MCWTLVVHGSTVMSCSSVDIWIAVSSAQACQTFLSLVLVALSTVAIKELSQPVLCGGEVTLW